MSIRSYIKATLLLVALVCIVMLSPYASLASWVGGIIIEGVYVQEYWQAENPYHAICSTRADSLHAILRQSETVSHTNHRPNGSAVATSEQRAIGDTLCVWRVPPGGILEAVPASVPSEFLEESPLVTSVYVDGFAKSIWGDHGVRWPDSILPIATYASLNVPGGRWREAWMEQSDLWVESGEPFFVDIVLGFEIRGLVLDRSASFVDLPATELTGAESQTLPVNILDDTIEIDASGVGYGELQRVRVFCVAPEVEAPTMASIRGRLAPEDGRSEFNRGILVRPATTSQGPAG